jgi:hypothetical protein
MALFLRRGLRFLRHTPIFGVRFAACAYALLLAGCGSETSGPDDVPIASPSFASHIRPIFDSPTCVASDCHASPDGRNGLILEGITRDGLVGVTARSGIPLVIAGDAQNSYIVRKLEGRNIVSGDRMPLPPNPALSAGTIQTIRNWIDQGALDN